MRRLIDGLNRQAAWIGAGGIVLVAIMNWQAWRQDRDLAGTIRRQRRHEPCLDATPKVSILVAAWNEAEAIEDHLESFHRLSYPNRELVICAGGSDGTFGLASGFVGAGVTVLEQRPGEGKQRALQRCREAASGEVIFLTDADCLLSDQSFQTVIAPIVNGEEVVATGTMRPLPGQLGSAFVRSHWFTDLYVASHQTCDARGLLGANAAIRCDVLDAVGAFRDDVGSGTDYYLAKRLLAKGYRIRFVPASDVETRYAEGFAEEARRQSRWLRNVVTHGRSFGARTEVYRALFPSIIGIAMLVGPLSGLWPGRIALVGWSLALAHAVVSRARYLAFARIVADQPRRFVDLALLPLFTVADFGVWAMAIPRYLIARGRAAW